MTRRATPSITLALVLTGDQLDHLAALVAERLTPPEPPREWLTITEAADYAGVSRQTIASLRRSGKLRASGIGRRALVNRGDLDRLIRPGGDANG